MRTNNPALNESLFAKERAYDPSDAMTVQGTVNKCFVLFFLVVIAAWWVWEKLMQPAPVLTDPLLSPPPSMNVMPYVLGGGIAGMVLGFVTVFKPRWSPFTAPAYAVCEGFLLGGMSALFERAYPGVVVQAVGLTFAVMFCMLGLYKSGLIKVTRGFVAGLTAATGAVVLVYVTSWILSFFNIHIPFIYGNSPIGIGFSLIVVGIAAFNLILDFYVIEEGEHQGAAKYMEWYGAFGLMVTLIWLYLEILRLLSKLRSRD